MEKNNFVNGFDQGSVLPVDDDVSVSELQPMSVDAPHLPLMEEGMVAYDAETSDAIDPIIEMAGDIMQPAPIEEDMAACDVQICDALTPIFGADGDISHLVPMEDSTITCDAILSDVDAPSALSKLPAIHLGVLTET